MPIVSEVGMGGVRSNEKKRNLDPLNAEMNGQTAVIFNTLSYKHISNIFLLVCLKGQLICLVHSDFISNHFPDTAYYKPK